MADSCDMFEAFRTLRLEGGHMGRKSKSRREPRVEWLGEWHPHHPGAAVVWYDRVGVRHRESMGKGSTKKQGWDYVEQLRTDGRLWCDEAEEPGLTFEDFMPTYWRIKEHRAKASTVSRDKVRWRGLQPVFDSAPLREVTAAMVEDFLDEQSKRGVSDSTRNRYHALLSGILTVAHERGIIPAHPLRGRLRQKAEKPKHRRVLTEVQMARLMDAVRKVSTELPDPYLELAVLIPLTGVRPGEEPGCVLSLRWDNLDFEKRQFVVPETKRGTNEVYPFGEYLAGLLEARYRNRTSDTWVFPSRRKDGHLTAIDKPFARAVRLAGLTEDVCWYSLRHTLGTALADKKTPIHVISAIMKHRDVHTTMKYLRPFEHLERAAVEEIEGLATGLNTETAGKLTTKWQQDPCIEGAEGRLSNDPTGTSGQ